MMRFLPAMLSFAFIFVGSPSFTAPAKDVPVVSTFSAVTATNDSAFYTIKSDTGAPYQHTAKGSTGVESHIQGSGAYELDVYYFTTPRKLTFVLELADGGSADPAAPTGTVTTAGRLITKCPASNHLLNMDPTQPLDACALSGRFDFNGRTMLVRMDADAFPGTTKNVRITCTGLDPNNQTQCSSWTLQSCTGQDGDGNCTQWGVPSGGSADRSAHLMTILEEKVQKGKTTQVKMGDYIAQFEIRADRQ